MSSKHGRPKHSCECGECGRKDECRKDECKKEESCCDASYRMCKCNKMVLNVCPHKCILENNRYKELYTKLYETILENNLEIELNNMYIAAAPNNTAADYAYTNFYTLVTTLFAGQRIVVTEQDGTVVLDSYAGVNNTRANWRAKTINENHNSRLAIINAQLFKDGTGYETKLSTTTNTVQLYVAIRGGKFNDSYGTFRLSVDQIISSP